PAVPDRDTCTMSRSSRGCHDSLGEVQTGSARGTGPMTTWMRPTLLLTTLLTLVALPATSGPQTPEPGRTAAGQSVTLLPDGRWLFLGGEDPQGVLGTGRVLDPETGVTTPLRSSLHEPRAWHTATVLPNGFVFVFGGLAANGRTV